MSNLNSKNKSHLAMFPTPQELIKMTDTPEKCEQLLISAVRRVANDRYEQGWSAIVEAWSDGDILEYLSNAQMDLPKAIMDIQEWVDIRKEMEENCQF
jgi:hypothetical protein